MGRLESRVFRGGSSNSSLAVRNKLPKATTHHRHSDHALVSKQRLKARRTNRHLICASDSVTTGPLTWALPFQIPSVRRCSVHRFENRSAMLLFQRCASDPSADFFRTPVDAPPLPLLLSHRSHVCCCVFFASELNFKVLCMLHVFCHVYVLGVVALRLFTNFAL